jgi:hypothetical protein
MFSQRNNPYCELLSRGKGKKKISKLQKKIASFIKRQSSKKQITTLSEQILIKE